MAVTIRDIDALFDEEPKKDSAASAPATTPAALAPPITTVGDIDKLFAESPDDSASTFPASTPEIRQAELDRNLRDIKAGNVPPTIQAPIAAVDPATGVPLDMPSPTPPVTSGEPGILTRLGRAARNVIMGTPAAAQPATRDGSGGVIEPPPSQAEVRATAPGGGPLVTPPPATPAVTTPIVSASTVPAPPAQRSSTQPVFTPPAPVTPENPLPEWAVERNKITPTPSSAPVINSVRDLAPHVADLVAPPINARPAIEDAGQQLDAFRARLDQEHTALVAERSALNAARASLESRLGQSRAPGARAAIEAEVASYNEREGVFSQRRGAFGIAAESFNARADRLRALDKDESSRGGIVERGTRAAVEAQRSGISRAAQAVTSLGEIPLYAGPGSTSERVNVPNIVWQASLNLANGLLQAGAAPAIGVGAAGRAALEKADPELASTTLVGDDATARGIRLGLMPTEIPVDRTPEEHAALGAPITVGEAVEILGALGTIMGIGRIASSNTRYVINWGRPGPRFGRIEPMKALPPAPPEALSGVVARPEPVGPSGSAPTIDLTVTLGDISSARAGKANLAESLADAAVSRLKPLPAEWDAGRRVFTLTEDIPGHARGDVVSATQAAAEGYDPLRLAARTSATPTTRPVATAARPEPILIESEPAAAGSGPLAPAAEAAKARLAQRAPTPPFGPSEPLASTAPVTTEDIDALFVPPARNEPETTPESADLKPAPSLTSPGNQRGAMTPLTPESVAAALEDANGNYITAAEALAGSDNLLSVLNAANQARKLSPEFNDAMGNRPRTGSMLKVERDRLAQEDRGGWDLNNDNDLIAFVKSKGGIRPDPGGDLSEKWEAIPKELRSKTKGLTPSQMAEVVNESLGRERNTNVINDAEILRRLSKSTVRGGARGQREEVDRAQAEQERQAADAHARFMDMPEAEQIAALRDMTGASEADARALLKARQDAARPVEFLSDKDEPTGEKGALDRALLEGFLAGPEREPREIIREVLDQVGGHEAVAKGMFGGDIGELDAFVRRVHAEAVESSKAMEPRAPYGGRGTSLPARAMFRGVKAGRDPHAIEGTIGGTTFSPDEKVARAYAGEDGRVVRENLGFKNLLAAKNWMEAKRALELPASATMPELIRAASDAGHDGLAFQGAHGQEYIKIPSKGPEPKTEKTPLGDQVLVPDTPKRSIPTGKAKARVEQRPLDSTPLFGQDKAERDRNSDDAQGMLLEDRAPFQAQEKAAKAQEKAAEALTKAAGAIKDAADEVRAAVPEAPKPAPVTWGGWQERFNKEPLPLWSLTQDIPGHPKGSTVGPQALQKAGFEVPEPPEAAPTGASPYKYSSVEIRLPAGIGDAVRRFAQTIPQDQLAPKGVEAVSHVTVRYGIQSSEPDRIKDALKDQGPVEITLGTVKSFPDTGDGEVLYVEAQGPAVDALHEHLTDALVTVDTQKTFKPHVTLAYLKKGEAKAHVGDTSFVGRTFTASEVVFSPRDGAEPTVLALPGRAVEPATEAPRVSDTPSGVLDTQPPTAVNEPVAPYTTEPAPAFFSALRDAADKRLPARASAEQIMATIRATPGVKADEITWTYLPEWLAEQKGPIAKADVLAYLDDYGVKVRESLRGQGAGSDPGQEAFRRAFEPAAPGEYARTFRDLIEPLGYHPEHASSGPGYLVIRAAPIVNPEVGLDELNRRMDLLEAEREPAYRAAHRLGIIDTRSEAEDMELARLTQTLTIIDGQEQEIDDQIQEVVDRDRPRYFTIRAEGRVLLNDDEGAADFDEAVVNAWRDQEDRAGRSTTPNANLSPAEYEGYKAVRGGESYRELLFLYERPPTELDKEIRALSRGRGRPGSGHDDAFSIQPEDQPRLDALLSRRVGLPRHVFRPPHFRNAEDMIAHVRFDVRTDADGRRGLLIQEVQDDLDNQIRKRQDNLKSMERALPDVAEGTPARPGLEGNIADAKTEIARLEALLPFRGGKSNELVMKRVLRFASEQGYDFVGLATGAQQAELYNLSTHVKRIMLYDASGGISVPKDGPFVSGMFVATPRDRGQQIERRIDLAQDPEALNDLVGPEMAARLLARPSRVGNWAGLGARIRSLEDLDLEMPSKQAQGKKKTYDEILLAVLNKLAKPWGQKVEDRYLKADAGSRTMANDDAGSAAAIGAAPIHAIAITPEMREALLRHGFPLFEDRAAYGALPAEAKVAADALNAQDIRNNPNFTRWFGASKVVDEKGAPKVAYRGDNRADRLDRLRKARASSAHGFFFTEDPAIASSYATGKVDRNAVDDVMEGENFRNYFRFTRPGVRGTINLHDLWYHLSRAEQARVEDVVRKSDYTEEQPDGTVGPRYWDFSGERSVRDQAGWDYEIRDNRGNVLDAAASTYLGGAILHGDGDEALFLDLLKEAGIEGEYVDPWAEAPAVTPVYLAIQTPLDTAAIPPAVVDRLRAVARRSRRQPKEGYGDPWNMAAITPKVWISELEDNLTKGTTTAWTSIPKEIVRALQGLGYDGIKDTGGKMGGQPHAVWIAFEPTQVKSAIGNRGTFDPSSPSLVREEATPYAELPARAEPAPAFYSTLLQAAEKRLMPKMSRAQVLGVLGSTPGVKKIEIHWTGLEAWLAGQPEVGIKKTDVLDFIRANQVRVAIRELSEATSETEQRRIEAESGLDLSEEYGGMGSFDSAWDEVRALDPDPEYVKEMRAEDPDWEPSDEEIEYRSSHPAGYEVTGNRESGFSVWVPDASKGVGRRGVRDDGGVQFDRLDAAQEAAGLDYFNWLERAADDGAAPRHGEHVEPGGLPGTYRERLFVWPPETLEPAPTSRSLWREKAEQVAGENGIEQPHLLSDAALRERVGEMAAQEDVSAVDRPRRDDTLYEPPSSHFDQPNLIAHARLDDGTLVDGTPVLRMQEAQSDWRHAVLSEGERTPEPPPVLTELPEGYKVESAPSQVVEQGAGKFRYSPVTKVLSHVGPEGQEWRRDGVEPINLGLFMDEFTAGKLFDRLEAIGVLKKTLRKRSWVVRQPDGVVMVRAEATASRAEAVKRAVSQLNRDRHNAWSRAVPPFPWLKNWLELVMKDGISEAARTGKQWFVWTTGKQQAERWSQKVTENIAAVRYHKTGHSDGPADWVLDGWSAKRSQKREGEWRDPDVVQRVTPDELPNYVGKELAQKLIAADGEVLTGQDLTFGGSEFRAIYDTMALSFARAFAKPFKSRVEDVQVNTAPTGNPRVGMTMHGISITPEMVSTVLTHGLPIMEPRAPFAAVPEPRYPLRDGADRTKSYALFHEAAREQLDLFGGNRGEPGKQAETQAVEPAIPAAQGDTGRAGNARAPVRASQPALRGFDAGAGVRTLALALARDLANLGYVSLRGYRVSSAEELGPLAQIWRDPRYETFRIVYVDDAGTILAHEAMTSRSAGAAEAWKPDDDVDDWIATRRVRMAKMGATGYYLLHNHPTTAPIPSREDRALTTRISRALTGFKAHVIIDHGSFGILRPDGTEVMRPVTAQPDARYIPAVPHDILDVQLTSPQDVVRLGKAIEVRDGWVALLYRGAAGQIIAAQEMPRALFLHPTEATNYLRAQKNKWDADSIFAYSSVRGDAAVIAAAQSLVDDGRLRDAWVGAHGAEILSDRERGVRANEDLATRPIVRFAESGAPYNDTTDEDLRELGRAFLTDPPDYESWAAQMRTHVSPAYYARLAKTYQDLTASASDVQTSSARPTGVQNPAQTAAGDLNAARGIPLPAGQALMERLHKILDVPISEGRVGGGAGRLGFTRLKGGRAEAARLKVSEDLSTAAHEAGHVISAIVWGARPGARDAFYMRHSPDLMQLAEGHVTPNQEEGWAEFWRLYLQNADSTRAIYPDLTRDIEDALAREDQPLLSALQQWGDDYRAWRGSRPRDRIRSHVVREVGKTRDLRGTLRRTYTNLLWEGAPLDRAVNTLAAGHPLGPEQNASLLKSVLAGAPKLAEYFLFDKNGHGGTLDFHTRQVTGPSLEAVLNPVKATWQDWSDYMIARRLRELMGRPDDNGKRAAGLLMQVLEMSAADVHGELAAWEIEHPEYEAVAAAFQTWNKSLLKYLEDAGVTSAESRVAIEEANQDYFPFHRFFADDAEAGAKPMGAGGGVANVRSPVKTLKGSGRKLTDPLGSAVRNTYVMVMRAERNAVLEALVSLAESTPGGGALIEPLPAPQTGQQVMTVEAIAQIRRDLERNGLPTVALDMLDPTQLREVVRTFRPDLFRATLPGEIWVLRKGKPAHYQIHDPELYGALANLDRASAQWLKHPLAQGLLVAPAALLRAGATLSPEFLGRNPVRDTFARILYTAAASKVPLVGPYIDAGKALDGFVRGVFSAIRQDAWYDVWKRSGAAITALSSLDQESLQKHLDDVLAGRDGVRLPGYKGTPIRFGTVIQTPIQLLRLVSETMEEASRIAETRDVLRGLGVTNPGQATKGQLLEAGGAARDVTLDFNRMGVFFKVTGLNRVAAFVNPSWQSWDKLAREAGLGQVPAGLDLGGGAGGAGGGGRTPPVGGAGLPQGPQGRRILEWRARKMRGFSYRILMLMTLPSLLLWWYNHQDARWVEIPQWQKDISWIVFSRRITKDQWTTMTEDERVEAMRDGIVRIPKPFELGVLFGSVPERIAEWIVGQNPNALKSIGQSLATAAGTSMIPMPTVLWPLISIAMNWNNFFDRPVVSRGLQDIDPEFQSGPGTSRSAESMARSRPMGWLSHGLEASKLVPTFLTEAIRSPIQLESLIQGYAGNLGRIGLNAGDLALKALDAHGPAEPEKTWSDVPGIRGFLVRYPSGSATSIQDFYTIYADAQKAVKTLQFIAKKKPREDPEAYEREHEFALLEYVAMQATAKSLTQSRADLQEIREDKAMDAQTKRKEMDRVTLGMIEEARGAVEGRRTAEAAYRAARKP
jgi:2'-5' RNA ligase